MSPDEQEIAYLKIGITSLDVGTVIVSGVSGHFPWGGGWGCPKY